MLLCCFSRLEKSQHVNKLAEHSSDLSPKVTPLLCVFELCVSVCVRVWRVCVGMYGCIQIRDCKGMNSCIEKECVGGDICVRVSVGTV